MHTCVNTEKIDYKKVSNTILIASFLACYIFDYEGLIPSRVKPMTPSCDLIFTHKYL